MAAIRWANRTPSIREDRVYNLTTGRAYLVVIRMLCACFRFVLISPPLAREDLDVARHLLTCPCFPCSHLDVTRDEFIAAWWSVSSLPRITKNPYHTSSPRLTE